MRELRQPNNHPWPGFHFAQHQCKTLWKYIQLVHQLVHHYSLTRRLISIRIFVLWHVGYVIRMMCPCLNIIISKNPNTIISPSDRLPSPMDTPPSMDSTMAAGPTSSKQAMVSKKVYLILHIADLSNSYLKIYHLSKIHASKQWWAFFCISNPELKIHHWFKINTSKQWWAKSKSKSKSDQPDG